MLDELLAKQKLLMEKVPHDVRPDAAVKMAAGVKIIESLMLFLNSTGHKPWRPEPLAAMVQQGRLDNLRSAVSALSYIHSTNLGHNAKIMSKDIARKMISGLGIVEESVEYLNSCQEENNEPHKLEELVDILFFWLEQLAMSGFSVEDVVNEYHRKWAVNIKRYEDAETGDYSWDKRSDGVL